MARTEAQKSHTNALRRDVASSVIFMPFQSKQSCVVVSSGRRILVFILNIIAAISRTLKIQSGREIPQISV